METRAVVKHVPEIKLDSIKLVSVDGFHIGKRLTYYLLPTTTTTTTTYYYLRKHEQWTKYQTHSCTRRTFKQRQLDGVWLGYLLEWLKHIQLNRTINNSKRQEALIALSQDRMKINHGCFEVNLEKEIDYFSVYYYPNEVFGSEKAVSCYFSWNYIF